MAGLIGNGKRFNVTVGGAVTKDTVYVTTGLCGVYMKSATTSGEVVPVAIEGVYKFLMVSGASATRKFAVGGKVYATTTGALTATATGTPRPLGINVGAATVSTAVAGGQTIYVKLCSF